MSTTLTVPRAVPDRTRRLIATAAVPLAAAGPLAVAVLRGVLPYSTTDDTATMLARSATSPGAASAVVWLGAVAILTMPLGVLVAGRTAIGNRATLGLVAAVVAWLGFGSIAVLTGVDQVLAVAPNGSVALVDAIGAQPAVAAATALFVVGHILGGVLLGIAVWGAVPKWAAVALAGSQPLHLVAAVVLGNHPLDALAWALTAVGFAAAAVAWRRSVVTP
ncbi:MAG: hypothetical protein J0I34_10735 [Pseudonocardia sp.]|uniref:hypothetical protein n=1 Tax=unclassified Pseudonocardia TaxID=2619320 RepID=UPI00086A4314|nr:MULTISPECIES: hypothetical protein [unclassified Pseudonocardia]MBN9109250.1 hypothetical protein [Pseudonocardia sp.]ODU23127.1 MAG: hypothetical protein ABS80_15925 [Pseudonocardia sp. SCN 72-51]ODV07975.1 MAG: hypothetical protein ABT15_04555 [Pseudonocardia sp. SCN 73-27]